MEELIQIIIAEGVKDVVTSEPVLGGLTRPLTIRYTSSKGTVIESWSYPENSAMTKSWGAVSGVTYHLANDLDPMLIKVLNDKQFGVDLINEYLKQNKVIGLSTQQSLQQLSKFAGVESLLKNGAIMAALEVMQSIPDDLVFTLERKDYFIDKIITYLLD